LPVAFCQGGDFAAEDNHIAVHKATHAALWQVVEKDIDQVVSRHHDACAHGEAAERGGRC